MAHRSLFMPLVLVVGSAACAGAYDPQAEYRATVGELDGSFGAGGGGGIPAPGAGGSGGNRAGGDGGARGTGGVSGAGGSPNVGGDPGIGGSPSTGGSQGSGGSASMQDAAPPGDYGPCSLEATVTTVTDGGRYSPRNVGAIWIEDGSGRFVKTLAVWAKRRIDRLHAWEDVTSQAGLGENTVDAVTGATLSSHKTHQVSWDCTDTMEQRVPDGSYSVHFEMTDQNSSGPTASVDFTKGSSALTLTPPDEANFKGIKVVFTP
jgi:hypothetical protein